MLVNWSILVALNKLVNGQNIVTWNPSKKDNFCIII
jgi:hypothetical protein